MARTRGGLARRTNNFDNRKFAAAKEIANAHRRNNRFKIKFFLTEQNLKFENPKSSLPLKQSIVPLLTILNPRKPKVR